MVRGVIKMRSLFHNDLKSFRPAVQLGHFDSSRKWAKLEINIVRPANCEGE